MGRVTKYFKKEFRKDMFLFEYDNASDFYLTRWQRNRATLPLLLLRTIIFAGCTSIMVSAMVLNMRLFGSAGSWFIFLTHWGLVFNTLASGLALFISARAAFRGPIDASLGLPWYVKAYWAMCNVAVPLAFFITAFYWATLTEFAEQYALDPVLDVFIHAINAVVMLSLVAVSRHPARLLHFYWVLGLGLIYLIFTIIFHFSGAQTPFGTSYIYPMLDWDQPGPTIGLVFASAFGFIIMHCIFVGISVGRDAATRRFRESNTLTISDNDRYY